MFGLGTRGFFAVLVLSAAVFLGLQYGPPYFYAFQFNDFVRQEVKYAASERKTPDDLRRTIAAEGKKFDLDINPRDIRVTRNGPSFTLEFEYGWPIDLGVYKHTLNFHAASSGEIFER